MVELLIFAKICNQNAENGVYKFFGMAPALHAPKK